MTAPEPSGRTWRQEILRVWLGRKRVMGKKHESQALFQSVGRDGTDWLFVVGCDGGWAIMRNGIEVGLGTGTQASIDAGVRKFLSLTRVIVGSDAACDPAVGALLDRIEREGPATLKVPKDQRTIKPHASKESLTYVTA
jgi:hypothetical protein